MGGGGPQKGSSSSQNEIAPQLQPLFGETANYTTGLQSQIVPQFYGQGGFFDTRPQQIPGFTDAQNAFAQNQVDRFNQYSNNPYSPEEQKTLSDIDYYTSGPLGSSPATIAGINAVRTPVLTDLAMSGMGNSDAIGSNLAGAYAPIIAKEMDWRASLAPYRAQIGATGVARVNDLANQNMATQEQIRNLTETQGKADLQDFLRRQGLGQQFTTGILGGFPALSGTTSSTKQTGGGK